MPWLLHLLQQIGTWVALLIPVLLAAYAWPQSPLRKLVETWIDRRVAAKFDLELERFRHMLTLEGDRARNDLQRQLHDFGLYSTKRHEVYRELYRLILIADGAVAQLTGLRRVSAYEDYSPEDVTTLLQSWTVAGNTKLSILKAWDVDKAAAINELRVVERRVEIAEAHKAFGEAWNFYLMNSLYLDDALSQAAHRIFNNFRDNLHHADFPNLDSGVAQVALKKEASELTEQLKIALRADLWGSAGLVPKA